MARTVSDIVIDAPATRIMSVIADFEAYPQWATGMASSDVLLRDAAGQAEEVRFELDSPPIRDTFVLRYHWGSENTLTWELVPEESTMLKAMDGSYVLDPLGSDRTRVTYQLEVDVKLPLLGMLKRKAEKLIVDTALKGLKKRVEGAQE